MTGRVRYERERAVATITFDRPEARNAMTLAMYAELVDACDRLDADAADGVRVAVLRGAGDRAFVAGTDIAAFADFDGGEDGIVYERRIDEVIDRLEAVRVPTIAAVRGYAVGGGFAIAAVADLRLATPDARFGYPIARTVGNCLSGRNYARLVWLLGPSRAKRLLLTAGFLEAEEARMAGLVHEIVAPEELEERSAALAAQVAALAPLTVRASREAIRRVWERSAVEIDDLVREVYGSRDFREGVRAFGERRAPAWEGR